MKRIAIYILAGGLGTRMGREKARVRLGNRTLLGHVKRVASAAGLPVRVVRRDTVPRCGPIGGIYTALATMRAEAAVFLACDMPFVSPALILRAVDAHTRTGRPIFIEYDGRTGFPCVIAKSARAVLQQQIQRRQWSIQSLASVLDAGTIRLPKSRAFEAFNVNTPEDLALARQRLPNPPGRSRVLSGNSGLEAR